MSPPDPETRPAGAPWRVSGIVVVILAALLLVIGVGLGRRPVDPLMLAAFALLAAGWILIAVGAGLRRRG